MTFAHRPLGCIVFLIASLAIAGCTSHPSTGAAVSENSPTVPAGGLALTGLKKGLTPAEVRARLGEPAEVRSKEVNGVTTETWIYRRIVPGPAREVAVTTREVPYVDPITGKSRTTKELISKLENTEIEETTGLIFAQGILMDWRQVRVATTRYR